jgi:hypothetical protein
MTPDTLRATLAHTGLSDAEIDAAAARLGQLKDHIGRVERGEVQGGRLVNNWDATTFREQLVPLGNSRDADRSDNYVRRSIEDQDIAIERSKTDTIGMLVEDIRTNDARGLMNLAALWPPDKTGGILKADIRGGGELVKALHAERPRALTELLVKLSPEDRGAVLGSLPAQAAAELALQLQATQS